MTEVIAEEGQDVLIEDNRGGLVKVLKLGIDVTDIVKGSLGTAASLFLLICPVGSNEADLATLHLNVRGLIIIGEKVQGRREHHIRSKADDDSVIHVGHIEFGTAAVNMGLHTAILSEGHGLGHHQFSSFGDLNFHSCFPFRFV